MEEQTSSAVQTTLEQFLSDRFKANIQSFKKYLPDIASEFEHYQPQNKIKFVCSKKGVPNLLFLKNNELFFKNSEPFEFCKKQVNILINGHASHRKFNGGLVKEGYFQDKYLSQIINESKFETKEFESIKNTGYSPTAIIFGIGLGYQIAEFLEQIDVQNLILIEPDKDIFYASLHTFDWINLLTFFSTNNLGLKIITEDKTCINEILDFINKHGKFLASNVIYYVHYKTEKIKDLRRDVENALVDLTSAMGFVDDYLYGISHGCYSIIHKKNFITKNTLPTDYQNQPLFIVGSGPSLDNDLPFIAKNQDKAIIIACGTAIDALYHYGIKPDFYANTERDPSTAQALETIPDKNFLDDIILLASDVCHPLTVDKFKYTALFGKADEPLYKYLTEKYPQYKSIQYVTSMNPLVGNMGVAGAIYLGFKNLFLFGIDCGTVLKGKSHSDKTTLYKEYGNSDAVEEYVANRLVEGNLEKTCCTNNLFQMSVRKIEDILALNEEKGIICVNCSNGCKIKHTIPKRSALLAEEFDKKNKIDKVYFKKTFKKNKLTIINISEEQIYNLFKHQPITKLCSDLIEFISKKRNSIKEYIWMMEEISEHLAYLKTTKEYFLCSSCILPTINHFFVVITQALYLHAKEDNVLDIAENTKRVIIDFLTELPELLEKLPNYIMGEELKHYPDGLVGRNLPHCKAINFPQKQNLIKKLYDDPVKKFTKANI